MGVLSIIPVNACRIHWISATDVGPTESNEREETSTAGKVTLGGFMATMQSVLLLGVIVLALYCPPPMHKLVVSSLVWELCVRTNQLTC